MSAQFKAGEILILETGEYSDSSWHGPYRVAKDFDMRPLIDECKADYKPEYDGDTADPYNFRDWLFSHGYIEDFPARSIHIGSYNDIEIDC